MGFDHGLNIGQKVNNEQLADVFLCSTQGGMRRSHRTNSLVLISDHTKGLYEDRWDGKTFHYTGMGLIGDQGLNFQQNRTLADSQTNGIEVYLFEVFVEKEYVFMGQVELAGLPYQERQLDTEKNNRLVWVFPLHLVGGTLPYAVSAATLQKKKESQEKQARKLSNVELSRRAKQARKKSGERQTTSTTYDRDPYVSEYAKRRANGMCQLCEQPAPFSKNRIPYLETHHIDWLSKGGEDTVANTVALCPNCHRKMHSLNEPKDILKLKQMAENYI